MIDGIDGSGKSTVIKAWKDYLAKQGHPIFDLKKYWIKNKCYPEIKELNAYDYIFSCEPTYVGIGEVIRKELISNKNDYSAQAIAEAYSLDRLILYNKIIIPLLSKNKTVIQDRGISSSLAYQSLQDKKLDIKTLSELTGNKLALKYRPDHLIILDVSAESTTKRLLKRTSKKDDAIFEKINFQKKLTKKFKSQNFKNVFLKRKTKIHYLPADVKIDIMNKEAVNLFNVIASEA